MREDLDLGLDAVECPRQDRRPGIGSDEPADDALEDHDRQQATGLVDAEPFSGEQPGRRIGDHGCDDDDLNPSEENFISGYIPCLLRPGYQSWNEPN